MTDPDPTAAPPDLPESAASDAPDAGASGGAAIEVIDGDAEQQTAISEPAKLMRIAVMLRELQEEVRRAEVDSAGRDRLRTIHERAIEELCGVLSEDLQQELSGLTLPFEEGTPTESEVRVAQAQLIGWLEGLFQGIQAALFSQQVSARQQLAGMRPRGLPEGMQPPGGAGGGPGGGPGGQDPRRTASGTGQYL